MKNQNVLRYTPLEELLHAITHVVGVLFALFAFYQLMTLSYNVATAKKGY